MRLIAVSMIRNEADILPDFLGHCAALFDEVLVADHCSTDGTAEMLAAAARRMPLSVWRFPYAMKAQAAVMTGLAQEAARRGADHILPLDADEFPRLASRADLEARIAGVQDVAVWRWRNVAPADEGVFAAFSASGRHASRPGRVEKVSVSRRMAGSPGFAIGHGSHVARPRDRSQPPGPPVGELLHIPLRSAERLALKADMHLRANAARPGGLPPGQDNQYQRASRRMADLVGPNGAALRRRFALFYPHIGNPQDEPEPEPIDFAPLGRLGGLPAPLAAAAEVLAREALIPWLQPPAGDLATLSLHLHGSVAELVGRA